jgi:hypothetical protein
MWSKSSTGLGKQRGGLVELELKLVAGTFLQKI